MAIRINFITQFDNRGIKRAQRELADVGRNISRALDVAVIGGLAAATAGLASAIKSASNFAAEYEGVSQVFGNAAKSVQDFAKEASRTAGLSQTEALQASKVFGLFATKAGLSAESAANFSTTLVQLAGDLGSFNDVPTEEALAAIQSGLQGQAEPLRKFGVFLDDAALKEQALTMKIYDGTGALNAQQKMMASYSLILEQTNIQQGDYLKYADTFGNSTKTITKDLANLQAELGQAVLPAIESLLPAVKDLIPVFGTQLKEAIASVDWKAFFKILVDGITFLITYGPQLAGLATTMFAVSKAFAAADIATKLFAVSAQIATGKVAVFNAVMNANPILRVISLLGLLAVALAGVGIASQEAGSRIPTAITSRAMKAGQEAADAAAKRFKAGTKEQGIAVAAARKQAYDQVLKNYQFGLDQQLAASLAVPKVADVVVTGSGSTGTNSAIKKTTDAAKKAAEKAAEALAKANAALKDFKEGIQELSSGFTSLTQASSDLGQFQQTVVDTFDNINKKLAEGIADKTISSRGLDGLRNFLKAQQNLLEENARQRDEIIKKRSLAKALFDDVKSSLMGTGSLASLLDTQTRQVTKSVTKIVDGFTVTTKQTVDEVIGAKGVVGRLKEVVAKTKAFATQLTSLKALGLNPDLFKQIVEAGPEVGGELAKEILDGGSDSVKALNSTFQELQEVTATVAEQTAVVMFNAGVEVAGGLVAGLLSEETRLINAAKQLAESFNAEFKKSVDALKLPAPGENSVADQIVTYSLADIKLMQTAAGSPALAKSNAALANQLIARQAYTARGTTVSVVVNAGAGANGKTIGQQIQAELNKYAKSSAK
jgi:hypothetical protein